MNTGETYMELTAEEYRSGYFNLLDVKDRLESKVEKLANQLKQIKNQFNSRESYYKNKIVEQKHHFDVAVDALSGVEFEPDELEQIQSEAVLYLEVVKKMKEELKPSTKPFWIEMVNSYYDTCERAVKENTQLGLSVKQKEVIDNWLVRKS